MDMTKFMAGIDLHPLIAMAIALVLLLFTALFANYVVKALLLRGLNRVLAFTAYGRDPELRRQGFVERLSNIMPALVVYAGIPLVPGLPAFLVSVVQNVASAFMILTVAMSIGAAFNIVETI